MKRALLIFGILLFYFLSIEAQSLEVSILSQQNISCNNASLGIVKVSGLGGTAPYSFQLDGTGSFFDGNTDYSTPPDGILDFAFSNITEGTHFIVVMDADSTTAIFPVFMEINAIEININDMSETTCSGIDDGFIEATATNVNEPAQWSVTGGSPWQTDGNFSGLSPGQYTVTIQDALGCTATYDTIIETSSIHLIEVLNNTGLSCYQALDGTVELSAQGVNGPFEFSNNGVDWQSSGLFENLEGGLNTFYCKAANSCIIDTSFYIEQPDILLINSLVVENPLCFGDVSGDIGFSVFGGVAPFSYNLNGLPVSLPLDGLTEGNYNLEVTDAHNCVVSDDFIISAPDEINLSGTGSTSCFSDGSGELSIIATGGTGIFHYFINDGGWQDDGDFSNLEAGIYAAGVVDENGCSETININIEPTDIIVVNPVIDRPTCTTSDGSISLADVTGGNGPPYYYSTDQGLSFIPVTTPISGVDRGWYAYRIYDVSQSCYIDTSFFVNEDTNFKISFIDNQDEDCIWSGAFVSISVFGGDPPYTYNGDEGPEVISNSTNNYFSDVHSPNTYHFTITDGNGCLVDTNMTINSQSLPYLNIEGTDDYCEGNTGKIVAHITSGTPPYQYTISGDPTIYNSNSPDYTFPDLGAGTYKITVYDANNCPRWRKINLLNNRIETLGIVSDLVDDFCSANAGQVTVTGINGNPGYTFELVPPGGVPTAPINSTSFTELAGGNYTINIEDADGCKDTVAFTINTDLNGPQMDINVNNIIDALCLSSLNGEIDVSGAGGSGNFEYAIDGGVYGNSGLFTGLSAGFHTIGILDADYGCTYDTLIEIPISETLTLSMTDKKEACGISNDGFIEVLAENGSGTYTYSIDPPDLPVNSTGLFENITSGTYVVSVVDDLTSCGQSIVVDLDLFPELEFRITESPVSCSGDASGQIQVFAEDENGNTSPSVPYDFELSGPAVLSGSGNNWTFSDLSAGAYSLTMSDINGCVQIVNNIEIEEPEPLVIHVFSGLVISADCFGEDAEVLVWAEGGSGVDTYSFRLDGADPWLPADLFGMMIGFDPVADGNHTVEVQDINGCTDQISFLVVIPPLLEVSADISKEIECTADLAEIELSANGGTAPYAFSLDGADFISGSSPFLFTGLNEGDHDFEVRDINGCSANGTINILVSDNQPPIPVVDPLPVITAQCSVSLTLPTANDNCEGLITATTSNPLDYNNPGTYFVTWFYTDGINTPVSQTQTVIIDDTTDPIADCIEDTLILDATASLDLFPVNIDDGSTDNCALNNSAFTVIPNTFTLADLGLNTVTLTVFDLTGNSSQCTAVVEVTNNNAPVALCMDTTVYLNIDGEVAIDFSFINDGSTDNILIDAMEVNPHLFFCNNLDENPVVLTVTDDEGFSSFCNATVTVLDTMNPVVTCQPITIYLDEDGNAMANPEDLNIASSDNCDFNLLLDLQAFTCGETGINNVVLSAVDLSDNASTCNTTITVVDTISPSALCVDTVVVNLDVSGNFSIDSSFVDAGSNDECGISEMNLSQVDFSTTDIGFSVDTLYVIDPSGNQESCISIVNVINGLNVFSTPVGPLCFGDNNASIQLTATGGISPYTFELVGYGTNTSGTFTDLGAGIYNFIVTDNSGTVTFSGSVTISEPDLLVASANETKQVSCHGLNDAEIEIVPVGGTPSYSFFVNGTPSSAVIPNLGSDTYTYQVEDANGCLWSGSFEISEPDTLIATTSQTQEILCFGQADGVMLILPEGGTGEYSYIVNGIPESDSLITDLVAGFYTYQVSDENECLWTGNFNIEQPDALNIDIIYAQEINCFGDASAAIEINVVESDLPPYEYAFNNSAFGPDSVFENLIAGTYPYQVSDAEGCVFFDTLIIDQPDELVFDTLQVSGMSCFGDTSGTIQAIGVGGVSPYTYSINGGPMMNEGLFNILTPGTYHITIIDANSCEFTDSLLVEQSTEDIVFNAEISGLQCFNDTNGTILLSPIGGIPGYLTSLDSIDWNTNLIFTGLSSGNQLVYISDANGCVKDTVVFISQPDSLSVFYNELSPITCAGFNNASVQLDVSGGIPPYNSLFDNDTIIGSTIGIDSLGGGEYEVVIYDDNQCTKKNVFYINEPDTIKASIQPVILSCFDGGNGVGIVEVTGGSGSFYYQWDNVTEDQDSVTQSNLVANIQYTVNVYDAIDSSCSVSAVVIPTEPPLIEFDLFQMAETCDTNDRRILIEVISGGVEPFAFMAGNPDTAQVVTNPLFENLNEIEMQFTVIDAAGCMVEKQIIPYNPNLPHADFTVDQNVAVLNKTEVNLIDQSSNHISITWIFGDEIDVSGDLSFEIDQPFTWGPIINPTHLYQTIGFYETQLVVTSSFGCTDTAAILMSVKGGDLVFVPNSFTPNGDGINDIFNMVSSGISEDGFLMSIYDRGGTLVYQTDEIDKGWDGKTLKGKDAPPQVYIYVILYRVNRLLTKTTGSVLIIR